MSDDNDQSGYVIRIESLNVLPMGVYLPLTDEDAAELERQRNWVRGHYVDDAEHRYATVAGKLHLVSRILAEKWIEPHEWFKFQCLGVTVGDALAQELGMHWMIVDDENGRTPAIQYQDSSLVIFPTVLISKRVERGEEFDIYRLCAELIVHVRETIADPTTAKYKPRFH